MYSDGVILIDRQAALAEIDATIEGSLDRPEDVYIDKGLMMARKIIEKLPTIKSDTTRHGRWIKQENGLNLCSVCNVTKVSHLPFCGHCGAQMDADEIAERRAASDDYAEY